MSRFLLPLLAAALVLPLAHAGGDRLLVDPRGDTTLYYAVPFTGAGAAAVDLIYADAGFEDGGLVATIGVDRLAAIHDFDPTPVAAIWWDFHFWIGPQDYLLVAERKGVPTLGGSELGWSFRLEWTEDGAPRTLPVAGEADEAASEIRLRVPEGILGGTDLSDVSASAWYNSPAFVFDIAY